MPEAGVASPATSFARPRRHIFARCGGDGARKDGRKVQRPHAVAKPDNLMVSDKVLRRRNTMSIFQPIAKAATMGAIAVLLSAPFAAAEQGGRYWVPKAANPGPYQTTANPAQYSQPTTTSSAPSWGPIATNRAPYPGPTTTNRAKHGQWIAKKSTKRFATTQMRKRSPLAAMAQSVPDSKTHRLIVQVNTNDPAAMNLALNNATNVTQHYKELGEKVKIEVVTFGPGLHMLRDDTSPVKARIEQMALSTPEVSFKACGNTQAKMHEAEHKDIPIVPQAQVVNSGVVRVMELQEKGWSYVRP
jgi:intracellular sulfur oxidation DsrE/DsrF family protein